MPATPTPPVAPRRPVALEAHGDVRVDDYYWLRDRDDPGVTGYLEAENAYTEAMTAHTAERRDQLFEEMRSRIQETDLSVPWRRDAWWYYSRTVEGLQYPIHCRKPGSLDAPEQVLLDENAEAGGHDFFDLGALEVSPAHRLAAWSCDVAGDEAFVLRVRDLGTGADLGDEIANTYYGVAWANDDATVFYTTLDAAKRPWQVWRHRVGTPGAADVLVHQEDDERFHVGLGRTRTGRFVVVQIHSAVTTECHLIDADDPAGAPRLVAPRRQGVEYEIEHHGEQLFVVTNDEAENFRLMAAPLATPGRAHWREVVAHRPGVRLEEVDAFARHLVLYERAGGVRRIRVMDLASGEVHEIDQPEA
ncbi:MAG: oligopeptidase B, partial [Acidimicrobiales bacterium]